MCCSSHFFSDVFRWILYNHLVARFTGGTTSQLSPGVRQRSSSRNPRHPRNQLHQHQLRRMCFYRIHQHNHKDLHKALSFPSGTRGRKVRQHKAKSTIPQSTLVDQVMRHIILKFISATKRTFTWTMEDKVDHICQVCHSFLAWPHPCQRVKRPSIG